jgi:WD40 repeat protein
VTEFDDPSIRIAQGTITQSATGVAVQATHADLHFHAAVGAERSPPSAVPELPLHFLPRAAALGAVKAAVLTGEPRRVGTAVPLRAGLHGMAGIGKTVLASAVARDPEVAATFGDGVHWLTLGQAPDLLALQRALLEWVTGGAVRLESVPLGTLAIQSAFASKRCLVVLDDVWQRAHADAFVQLGDTSRLLVTTRDRAILTALGATRVEIDILALDEALGLLAQWAETPREALPSEAEDVARECGGLAFALALAGAQVRDGASWTDLRDALRDRNLKFLDHADRSVFGALDASVQALPLDQATRYRELAFVPEDTQVPESVVVRLWAQVGMREYEARALLRTLASKALLFFDAGARDQRDPSFLRLHDSQRDYLVAREPSDAHARLLDAHFAELPGVGTDPIRWALLDPGAKYLWQHLLHHLIEAGRLETAHTLARDPKWLTAKTAAAGVGPLLSDLALIERRAPSDATAHIERALRLEATWLYQDAAALPTLLYNRLRSSGLTETEIARATNGLHPPVRLRHAVQMDDGRTFRGHKGTVTACVYSCDATRILSASHDHTVREWDAATGRQLRCFNGHTHWVTACAYSPDGTRVLSASWDGTVREWDVATTRELRRLAHGGRRVSTCVYSPDGLNMLSGSGTGMILWAPECESGTIHEWDAMTGRELWRLEGHAKDVTACAYSPDGKRALSASHDGTVREWDLVTRRELLCLEGHTGLVNACSYSPDGTRALSASDDKTTREWDLANGCELRRVEGHSATVLACAYSPEGTRMLSASVDYTVREWDAATGCELVRFEGHSGPVRACAYSPDGSRILSASQDDTVREWDSKARRNQVPLVAHRGKVSGCACSPDGARVLSASHDCTLREWDAATGRELRRFEGHGDRVMACAYSPDGKRIVSASHDHTLREWDVATGRELRRLEGHDFWVLACAYSPDGKRVLSASHDYTVREWDLATRQELRCFVKATRPAMACAYSPDGMRVLAALTDNTLREWDASTGRELQHFEGQVAGTACSYSPDGTRVLAALEDNTVREWDAAPGRELRRFEGHSACVTACSYSPDGNWILSASYDCTIRIWPRQDPTSVFTIYGLAPFRCVAVGSGHLAAGDDRGNIWFLECDLF